MSQRNKNIIGPIIVVCYLLYLAGCSKPLQAPDISNTSPIKVGNLISGTLKLAFLGRQDDLHTASDIICTARAQIILDKTTNHFELSTILKYPNATEEETQMAEGILELVSSGFEEKNIPTEGQTAEYGWFVWEVLGQICKKLGRDNGNTNLNM
jgi:hypothetical protein